MKSEYPAIDRLRKKFDGNKPLTLREVCFVLWAELGVCSAQYKMFALWIKNNKLHEHKMQWLLWKALFTTFAEIEYPVLRNDMKKIVQANKMMDYLITQ